MAKSDESKKQNFPELIKDFSKVRDYIHDFFIYGYKTREDFKQKSSRTYDDEKRRIENWLNKYLKYITTDGKKHIMISVDSGQVPENPLYRAYYSQSFTDNDAMLHFMVMDILYEGEQLSLSEIAEQISLRFGKDISAQTVRIKLKEYIEEGILLSELKGKTTYFSLSPHTLESYMGFSEGFADMVKFFSETQEFGVVGNSIMKFAELENDIFLMKHNYIVHTLEDVILMDILEAMNEKRSINAEIIPARTQNVVTKTFVPLEIVSSVQTGRRYVMGYTPKFGQYSAYRLDSIKAVDTAGEYESYAEIHKYYSENKSRCFGVNFSSGNNSDEVLTPLKLTVFVDETIDPKTGKAKESHIIKRLETESRGGLVERTGENTYTVTLDVFDPNEAMQWVKSFICRIISVEGGTDEVRERFLSDMKRMKEMYGGESSEHIQ